MITIERYHDISCGHRVHGHESKCAHLHGHNYRITFACAAPKLDELGRVVDFSVVKSTLCQWLEDEWDHRFLVSIDDPWMVALRALDPSVAVVSFNPTAENMARHLVMRVGPALLPSGITLIACKVEETRKCSAWYSIPYSDGSR